MVIKPTHQVSTNEDNVYNKGHHSQLLAQLLWYLYVYTGIYLITVIKCDLKKMKTHDTSEICSCY